MTERAFIDTNIFIYAFEKSDSEKKRKAFDLINSENMQILTSIQVLNEFVSATLKKKLLPKEKAIDTALLIENEFETIPLNSEVFKKGMGIFSNEGIHISLWDSLIVAAAIVGECDTLYSEDMQHDYIVGNLKIKNPLL